jgi:hypothetical protein
MARPWLKTDLRTFLQFLELWDQSAIFLKKTRNKDLKLRGLFCNLEKGLKTNLKPKGPKCKK